MSDTRKTDREFVLDLTEERDDTFWRRVSFQIPHGDGFIERYIRVHYRLITSDELGKILEEGRHDRKILEEVIIGADIKIKGSDGKAAVAEFTPKVKKELLKMISFTQAAASLYIRTIGGGGVQERKLKN